MNCQELAELAVTAGYCLLENGAETYRVEESAVRIITAYGVADCDVFAVPSCIIVTLTALGENGEIQSFTRMKRIKERGTNLDRVSKINDICRNICKNTPACKSACRELCSMAQSPVYPFAVQVAATAAISFAFTLFFGGDLGGACWAVLCGVVLRLAMHGMERFDVNNFFANIGGSAIVAAAAFLGVALGISEGFDKIIIGTLMNLVPGVALTNSMRDIIAGDLLSGMTKLLEALMTAAAIALGSGISLYLLQQTL